jgi:hypothetical protein
MSFSDPLVPSIPDYNSNHYKPKLVGGLEHLDDFFHMLGVITQLTNIFQGVEATNQITKYYKPKSSLDSSSSCGHNHIINHGKLGHKKRPKN